MNPWVIVIGSVVFGIVAAIHTMIVTRDHSVDTDTEHSNEKLVRDVMDSGEWYCEVCEEMIETELTTNFETIRDEIAIHYLNKHAKNTNTTHQ